MWNPPTKKMLEKMPALYTSENTPLKDIKIRMHFFIGESDWYAAEYGDGLFFGFAILNGWYDCAEWGYFSLAELTEAKMSFLEVDRDMYWKVRPASEVEKIRMCMEWDRKEAA